MQTRHTRSLAAIGAVALTTLVGIGGGPASGATSGSGVAKTTVIATGLNNPRQLSFAANGDLYVAESGRGGSGPCIGSAESGKNCFGMSGSITRVRGTSQQRVVTGLPSLAGDKGASATGPSDVMVHPDGSYLVTMGLGNDPAVRADLPAAGSKFGTLLMGRFGSKPTIADDLAAFEAVKDFDKQGPDSNPTGLAMTSSGSHLVADAGANTVYRVVPGGTMIRLATFPNRMVPTPPFMPPGKMPMQVVPTSITQGPDGAFYVSELTGFPFPEGGARIWRLVPGQQPTVYARGLTNVTDLAWSGSTLYAVQIATHGLLSVPEGQTPEGSLVRVMPGAGNFTVVANLSGPYGLAIRGSDAYVTTCAVCAGRGTVTKVSLR